MRREGEKHESRLAPARAVLPCFRAASPVILLEPRLPPVNGSGWWRAETRALDADRHHVHGAPLTGQ